MLLLPREFCPVSVRVIGERHRAFKAVDLQQLLRVGGQRHARGINHATGTRGHAGQVGEGFVPGKQRRVGFDVVWIGAATVEAAEFQRGGARHSRQPEDGVQADRQAAGAANDDLEFDVDGRCRRIGRNRAFNALDRASPAG